MIIGCPKELKDDENRVGLTPTGVRKITASGHLALVERGAGLGSGIGDEEYLQAGATITDRPTIFGEAELVVKVKEPLPDEIGLFHEGQILFTFLHLAANEELTNRLLEKKIIAIAYETTELGDGSLPLLAPMSAIAGKLAPQVGATCLQSNYGGRGVLLAGIPGIPPAEVVILGAGNVGLNAARIALGMGAKVTVMCIASEVKRLSSICNLFPGQADTCIIDTESVPLMVAQADLLICGIYMKGAKTPKLVGRQMLKTMKPGSVIVDVSVDQGGCCETTRPTAHSHPTYQVDNVIHYCVTNIPGIVPRTATFALTHATLPYILKLADQGYQKALRSDESLRKGLNVFMGELTNEAVAKSVGLAYTTFEGGRVS